MYFWFYFILAGLGLYIYRAVNVYRDHHASTLVVSRPNDTDVAQVEKISNKEPAYRSPVSGSKWPLGLDSVLLSLKAAKEARLMEHFLDSFRRLGNTFQQFVGFKATIYTIEPENLDTMLVTNAKDWGIGMRRAVFLPMFGDGLFTQEGDAWKHSRDTLRPQFYRRQYDNLDVFRPHIENLIQAMAQADGVVELQPLFFRLALDVNTEFLFGESVLSQDPKGNLRGKNFEAAFDLAQDTSVKRLRFQKLYWLVGGKRFREACGTVHRFADDLLDTVITESDDRDDEDDRRPFLKAVVANYTEREAQRGQVVNLLIAGRDSTACLLGWTFFHLVRHPEVMEKLRAEISPIDESEKPLCRADLMNLTYLQCIIKEVLRLHPPLPFIGRTALKPTMLPVGGGLDQESPIFIPKGTSVFYSPYSLHRRPDIYGLDAEIFRPERWEQEGLSSRETTYHGGTYLPFGSGPRMCLGMDFALTEASYTTLRILQRFPNLKSPAAERIQLSGHERQTAGIALRPTDSCRVELGQQ